MLSYQHLYHAGNHADVIKHLSWLAVIQYLNKKDKPYSLFDSHAGEGVYRLDDMRNREKDSGVANLYDAASDNPLLSDYMSIISEFANQGVFPGSPAIANTAKREGDPLYLLEKHPSAYAALKAIVAQQMPHNVVCHRRDAFEGVIALSPPKIRRGAILIDPPYEQQQEYIWVADTVEKLVARWPQASILVWYPLLGQRSADKAESCGRMLSRLFAKTAERWRVELTISDPQAEQGMYGSGVLAINPPWTLADTISAALTDVCRLLANGASWQLHE